MASIRREIVVEVPPDQVWQVIRDIGNPHVRLFPGVLSDAHLHGDGRKVTFTNGLVLEEPTVELNDDIRRYAWTAVGGSMAHHNASLQVFDDGDGKSRIVWITDVLPHEAASAAARMMDAGAPIMRATLEAAARASTSS
jgi:carbon monoxide dehydrogenase subunit G